MSIAQGEESDMTESGFPGVAEDLSMSVVGYELNYRRVSGATTERPPEDVASSGASIDMSVTGATVAHLHNKPIKTVAIEFTAGPFQADRVAFLLDRGTGLQIGATLPWADFPAVWATLRLDRVATLVCTIERGTDRVVGLTVRSQGSLGALFGV